MTPSSKSSVMNHQCLLGSLIKEMFFSCFILCLNNVLWNTGYLANVKNNFEVKEDMCHTLIYVTYHDMVDLDILVIQTILEFEIQKPTPCSELC